MIQKLDVPLLLQSESDCEFMIAEKVEIFCNLDFQQLTYYGVVYNYEEGRAEVVYEEGRWVYDANVNVKYDNND